MKRFGHEIALVVDEAATAVQFQCAVAVVYFEMKELGAVFARSGFSEIEELSANSLPSMRGVDEYLINPCAFTAILEAKVETDHQIADRCLVIADQINEAEMRIA